jgi:hypothetical protein
MRFILLAVMVCGCGTVTARDVAGGQGGGAGELSAGGRGGGGGGGELAAGGQGGGTGELSAGGRGGGAATWPACPYQIAGLDNAENATCADTCYTDAVDDAGLSVRDNFGACIGTTAAGLTVYCRQNLPFGGPGASALAPEQTPDAGPCP